MQLFPKGAKTSWGSIQVEATFTTNIVQLTLFSLAIHGQYDVSAIIFSLAFPLDPSKFPMESDALEV